MRVFSYPLGSAHDRWRDHEKIAPAILAACSLFLSGCEAYYKPDGFHGYGFSETRLAPDMVRVKFRGNNVTRMDRAQDFAALRAAELCIQSGYSYFAVFNENSSTTSRSVVMPGSSYTSGSVYGTGAGVGYSGNTTYMPAQTITMQSPESGLLVRFFKTKPSDIMAFDAAFLADSIRTKYKIK